MVAPDRLHFVGFLATEPLGFVSVLEDCWTSFLWDIRRLILLSALEGIGLGQKEELLCSFALPIAAYNFKDWMGSASVDVGVRLLVCFAG